MKRAGSIFYTSLIAAVLLGGVALTPARVSGVTSASDIQAKILEIQAKINALNAGQAPPPVVVPQSAPPQSAPVDTAAITRKIAEIAAKIRTLQNAAPAPVVTAPRPAAPTVSAEALQTSIQNLQGAVAALRPKVFAEKTENLRQKMNGILTEIDTTNDPNRLATLQDELTATEATLVKLEDEGRALVAGSVGLQITAIQTRVRELQAVAPQPAVQPIQTPSVAVPQVDTATIAAKIDAIRVKIQALQNAASAPAQAVAPAPPPAPDVQSIKDQIDAIQKKIYELTHPSQPSTY